MNTSIFVLKFFAAIDACLIVIALIIVSIFPNFEHLMKESTYDKLQDLADEAIVLAACLMVVLQVYAIILTLFTR